MTLTPPPTGIEARAWAVIVGGAPVAAIGYATAILIGMALPDDLALAGFGWLAGLSLLAGLAVGILAPEQP